MSYVPYDPATPNPTQTGTNFANSSRDNLRALRDAAALGTMPGWQFWTSGGTAEQPSQLIYGLLAERLRVTLTWGTAGATAGMVTQAVYAYSSNSGSTYFNIGTQTMVYDSNGFVTNVNWS